MEINVRPIDDKEIPALADLHVKAFAGFPNARLGTAYATAMLRWFHRHPDGIALVATAADKPCGYVVGAPLGYNREFARDLFWPAVRGYLTHPLAWFNGRVIRAALRRLVLIFRRPKNAPTYDDSLPRPAYSLVSIAVSAKYRGRRIGETLLSAFEHEARRRSAKAIRLTTTVDNLAAQKLYTRCGWIPGSAHAMTICYYRMIDIPGHQRQNA